MEIEKQLADYYIEAEKSCRAADHMIWITYPVVKDKSILLKALENLHNSATKIITLILKYEYLHKRIQLYRDTEKNLETFFKKCSNIHSLSSQDINNIRSIIRISRKCKESTFEFSKAEKAVIMEENGEITELSLSELKEYSKTIRALIDNTGKKLKEAI